MIQIQDVTYRYDTDAAPALDHVSLTIERGEFFAVAGHNGSGKSTLAKLINALLLPQEGAVFVEGMDTKDPEFTLKIRQKVGMVFQNPDNQIVTTVVEEDVAFGPENLGVPTEEIIERVNGSLSAVGMSKYSRSAPHLLSGGQKQRVAIAGMLAMKPEILVLDEATAMLDPRGRKDVLDIVRRLNRDEGMTVIMITQYMEEAVECDRLAVMAGGRVLVEDTPRKVFAQAGLLREHRLDVPQMAQLRDRLLLGGVDVGQGTITVEEMADKLCPLLLKN